MSKLLIERSKDLTRLKDDDYDLEVRLRFLLVKSVPYVNAQRQICRGVTTTPGTHVVYFIGEQPCHQDGTEIAGIKHPDGRKELEPGLIVDRSFSAKPIEGPYPDFYEKMTRYVGIICHPAQAIDPSVTARVSRPAVEPEEESVFKYPDTASSRAGITVVARKLRLERIAIVGVGGTGSYVLDLVAKTPVKEIHLFDEDDYENHSAFRCPGAATIEELRSKPKKVVYLRDRYSAMRHGIVAHECFITEANVDLLQPMTFVFLCMDAGPAKRIVVDRLKEWQVPLIDVGMGIEVTDGAIGGMLSVAVCTPGKSDHVDRRVSFADAAVENDYSRNIQVADLNALNAALAVIKWKKLFGFYHDFKHEHFSSYAIDGNLLTSEECS